MTSEQLLKEGARRIGITDINTDSFLSYAALLRRWGQRVNLSSLLSEREIIIKHMIDSLTVAEFVPPGSRVLDIGTGAGFPGIPLYINDPSLEVTLVESAGKKVAFLKEVKRSLGLSGVSVHNSRAEEVNAEMRGGFDRVTFRAVGSMDTVVALGSPYLDIGGNIVIMKGPRGIEEWEDYTCRNSEEMELLSAKHMELPFSGDKRVIIAARPVSRRMETEA